MTVNEAHAGPARPSPVKRRTKIVATWGPAVERADLLTRLLHTGVDVLRFNLSHGGGSRLETALAEAQTAIRRSGRRIAVLLDTRGAEIRTGGRAEEERYLRAGERIVLRCRGTAEKSEIWIDYADFACELEKGDTILLGDGEITLEALDGDDEKVDCRVINGGSLPGRRKVTVPGLSTKLPALTAEDARDIQAGLEQGVSFVAASFIREAAHVHEVRRVIEAAGGSAWVIAKIETRRAVDNFDEILMAADGIMVARGDLGLEFPPEDIPFLQKRIIEKCNRAGKPVITATQMLESMTAQPRPTRAESADVANAILDGTDAVMLSGETAVGKYPLEAVRMMARIAERADVHLERHRPAAAVPADMFSHGSSTVVPDTTEVIGRSTYQAAAWLGATAIIVPTSSGYTPRMIARHRPQVPIVAVTMNPDVADRLSLIWGVAALTGNHAEETDDVVADCIETAVAAGFVGQGDLVLVTGGFPTGVAGATNMMRVETVAPVLLRGTGVGGGWASGRAVVVENPKAASDWQPGDILVAMTAGPDYMPMLKTAAALIVEEEGLTCDSAIAGLSLGIPTIVGAPEARSKLGEPCVVTVDARRGIVYLGKATVR